MLLKRKDTSKASLRHYERHVVPRPPWACPLKGWLHCLSIWWETPHIGRFHIEPTPRDLIKGTLANGLVWEPHVVRSLQHWRFGVT